MPLKEKVKEALKSKKGRTAKEILAENVEKFNNDILAENIISEQSVHILPENLEILPNNIEILPNNEVLQENVEISPEKPVLNETIYEIEVKTNPCVESTTAKILMMDPKIAEEYDATPVPFIHRLRNLAEDSLDFAPFTNDAAENGIELIRLFKPLM